MKKKQTRTLTRLTSVDTGKPVYIDMSLVAGVEAEVLIPDYSYQQSNQGTISINATTYVPPRTGTRITLEEGSSYIVVEHYLEVLAIVEGRDPAPARIMYGSNKNS